MELDHLRKSIEALKRSIRISQSDSAEMLELREIILC